jgi:hypothetical protein
MRFLSMVKMDESKPFGQPPPALFAAMDELVKNATADGSMIETGGLLPSAAGALVTLKDGKVTVHDGPFAEAKELIGGYAIFELRSKDEAIERTRQFLQLHADLWPGVQATCEVRQIAGPEDFPF